MMIYIILFLVQSVMLSKKLLVKYVFVSFVIKKNDLLLATCSISSLNMSTRKSSAMLARLLFSTASLVRESTAATRTEKHSSSRPWTKAPQLPRLTRLTASELSSSFGASSAHFLPTRTRKKSSRC